MIMDGINIRDYGAIGDGIADDTLAIQLAIDAARSSSRGPMHGDRRRSTRLYFPDGSYSISHLDWTRAVGLHVIGKAPWGVTLYADRQSGTGKAVMDLTGSLGCLFDGLIVSAKTPGGTLPAVQPSVGWLVAASEIGGDSTMNLFHCCATDGAFSRAACFIFGSTDLVFDTCAFEQGDSAAPAVYLGAHNVAFTGEGPGALSLFASIAGGTPTTGEITFSHGGMGNQLAGATSSTLLLYDIYSLRIRGGVMGGSGTDHVRFWGGMNRAVLFDGVQFSSERSVPKRYGFFCENSIITNLTVNTCDFEHNGFDMLDGSLLGHSGGGQFPGCVLIGIPPHRRQHLETYAPTIIGN